MSAVSCSTELCNQKEIAGYRDERKGEPNSRSCRVFHHPLGEASFQCYNFKPIAVTWETNYVTLSCKRPGDRFFQSGLTTMGTWGLTSTVVQFDHLIPAVASKICFSETMSCSLGT